MSNKRKVQVTATFRGAIYVSEEDYAKLVKDSVVDGLELSLDWDEVMNLDCEVELG